MKNRPEPSGASHIQTGRLRVNAGKVETILTFGKGWAAAASAESKQAANANRINRFMGVLRIENL